MLPPGLPFPSFDAMGPERGRLFKAMRSPDSAPKLLIEDNIFVEKILPGSVVRKLTEEEMAVYRAPFPDAASRKPILVWPSEIPIGGAPSDTHAIVENYTRWMMQTDTPMLYFWAKPGALTSPETATWMEDNVANIGTHFLGEGLHYLPEDHGATIGKIVADWTAKTLAPTQGAA